MTPTTAKAAPDRGSQPDKTVAGSLNTVQQSPFGVEVTGLDIRRVTTQQLSDLQQLIAQQGVAVLRDQAITDTEFVRFLQQLGPLTFTAGEPPIAGQPLLNRVTNVGRDRPPRSVFHTDTSYVAEPPSYTALKAIALPSAGGETLFSDQYRAYQALPSFAKQRLKGAELLHRVSGLSLANDAEAQTWQPLFRQHPLSRKVALYLSTPQRCQRLRTPQGELSAKDSARVIQLLYQHSIRDRHLYRHRWQANDILIWDNRCTLHRADHSAVVGDRILHRGLVAGEAPVAML